MRKLISLLVVCFALTTLALGQNQSPIARSQGTYYANAFNTWSARLTQGFTGIGAQAGLVYGGGAVTLKDGTLIYPFNVNAPLIWDAGQAGQENLVTSGVAGCTSYTTIEPGSCAVGTTTFANPHGRGSILKSGTFGLQEAINFAHGKGGGVVVIDAAWTADGGTDGIVALSTYPYSDVFLYDTRGPVPQWKGMAPSTLVNLATPATRSAVVGNTEVRSSATVGTFAAVPQFVCVAYIDGLGGESNCSLTYNFTPGVATLGIYFASPAASTGAVGWRAYAGITSLNVAYRMPITAATCTLSAEVRAFPACAIGSSATFAGPIVTTSLAPGYVANTYRPVPQGHTTFQYSPMNAMPLGPVQTNYGPFPATAAVAAAQPSVLGTAHLPSGYLNTLDKAIRVTGEIVYTAVATATPTISVSVGPTYTAGLPTAVCTMANTTALGAAVHHAFFACVITTNAIGAAGTVMGTGYLANQLTGGTTAGTISVSQATAAIAAMDLQTYPNSVYIVETFGTQGANPTQLLDLHVEALN